MDHPEYLILLDDFYPFGKYEQFLKNEVEYLAAAFEQVFIFSNCKEGERPIYAIPSNVKAYKFNDSLTGAEKIFSIRFLFSPIFWREVRIINESYKLGLSFSLFMVMLSALQAAVKWKKKIKAFLEEQKLSEEEVIVYSFWADHRALAAALLGMKDNIMAISRAHNWDVYFERHQPGYLPFRKYLHDHLAAQFYVSLHGRNYSLGKVPATDENKFRVRYLGTNDHGLNPEKSSGDFFIVSCSRISAIKRVDLIAEILKSVDTGVINWIHFGDGSEKDTVLAAAQEAVANNSKLHFQFKGETENEAILSFYSSQHIDLFMLTSEYEGIPVSVMEAMSFGIPVMAADAGGVREIVNNENGFLLPQNFEPRKAAWQIKNFINSGAAEQQKKRNAARQTWKEKFDADKNYPAFIQEIFSL